MLEIKNISKHFGGVTALDQCSFTIPRNKIMALVGPNGAGKTTLIDVISGVEVPDAGDILIDNQSLGGLRPDKIAKAGIARTWQQVRLFKYLTILEHLQLVESMDNTRLIKSFISTPKTVSAKYEKILDQFGIDRPLDTVVSELSYGQRKLLQLAMVLTKTHRLLLLDEPVAGVNAVVQKHIEEMLIGWKEKNETIVIVEHDMDFVRRLADYVVVMDQGRVLAEGRPAEVLQDKRVAEAYLGV